jgi:hypothetical protein
MVSTSANPAAEPTRWDASATARLDAIERSVERYGCFDLVEEDVAWLIERLREALRSRDAGT